MAGNNEQGFLFFFQIIVFLLFWMYMWVGAGGELTRKPVRKWSNDNVMEQVEGLGEHNCSKTFRKEVRENGEEGEGGKTKVRGSTSKQVFLFDIP